MAGIEYSGPEREARGQDQVAGPGVRPGEESRPSSLECPSCRRSDEVRAVPAVCLGGERRFHEETGDGDRRTAVRQVVPRLADALAAAPPAPETAGRTALGVLSVLVAIGTFIGGALGGHWFADAPGAELLFLAWLSPSALLGAILLIVPSVRTRRAFRARIAAGRDAAEEVWSRGWYCARCAVVHGADGRGMTLREFRRAVWSAGGYGELAEVYRVSGTTP
ncbi:hypothetical protein ACGFYY_06980 [Streptomyces sp. NPDC048331]|uniref:hypothetical protein n=1 Tax=Streptomyces sp. NPDC048331 TaxID=3365534 RepID=UPI0037103EB2